MKAVTAEGAAPGCSNNRGSRDLGNLSHLFPSIQHELSPSHMAAIQSAKQESWQGLVPTFWRCLLCCVCGFLGFPWSAHWAGLEPPSRCLHCHLPLGSWRPGEGEGRAGGMFGLLFLWALYNFKGFPLVHRGQGAEVSRHGLTSLSPPPRKGETHTHRGRRKGRGDPGKHFYPLIFLRLSAVEALSGRQSALRSLTLACWTLPPLAQGEN